MNRGGPSNRVRDFVCKFPDQEDTVNQIPTHPNGLHSSACASEIVEDFRALAGWVGSMAHIEYT
jgi:hypothetical protein